MRRIEIKVLEELKNRGVETLAELAELTGKSKGWLSEVIRGLERRDFVKREGRKIRLSSNYETRVLNSLMSSFSLEKLLLGKREDILRSLFLKPKSISELEKEFSKSMVYKSVRDFEELGVVGVHEGNYFIISAELKEFLKATSHLDLEIDKKIIVKAGRGEEGGGIETAFSKFSEYGVEYYPKDRYLYKGGEEQLTINHILAHAIALAEDKKQFAICGIFYLKNRDKIDDKAVREEVSKYDCLDRWLDMKAYISGGGSLEGVKNRELFLPWVEFVDKARVYGLNPDKNKYPTMNLEKQFELLGERIKREVTVYLLGGANLIFRSLKDATKDIDIVLESKEDFEVIEEGLKRMGYESRVEMLGEDIKSFVLEHEREPRFDIFISQVCRSLVLSEGMKERSERLEKDFCKLKVRLLSLTDVFLLKCVTEREGDVEDASVIVKRGGVDWSDLMEELEMQEKATGIFFSFSVLDMVEILEERMNIKIGAKRRLISYCLERALLVALEKPKTIKELKKELEFPEHLIYNKLKKMEKEGRIEVDRNGKLNLYRRIR